MSTSIHERLDDTRAAVKQLKVPQPKNVVRPPGPSSSATMARLVTRRAPIYQVFQEISNTCQPIGFVRLGGEHIYVLSDPALIWQAFVTESKNTMKGRGLQMTRLLLGNGLLNSEGSTHMRNRRLVQPAFHRQRIAAYCDDMVAASDDAEERWREVSAGAPAQIDVVREMSALTLDVVGRTLFGADLSGNASQVNQALNVVLEGFNNVMRPASIAMMRLPTKSRERLFGAIDQLDSVIAELISTKRAEIAAGRPGGDVLSLLLQSVDGDTGQSLSDDEVRDETMTLVLAGHETTAMALSWALRDLTMNAWAVEWLREELDRVPADGMADIPDLARTTAVVAEGMRLHPPAWVLGRYTTAPIELGGYNVPAGSTCIASQYSMHRDPRYWRDPVTFDPDRWLGPDGRFDERTPGVPRGVWFPFGFGSRRCIGEQFAWIEATLILARIVRNWDLKVLQPDDVQPLAAVTMRPRGTMSARLAARTPSP